MPFGAIFAALYFFICAWLGWTLVTGPSGPGEAAGALLACLGMALGLGLLMRRPWARWGGVAAALGLAAFGVRLVEQRGTGVDFVVLLAALASCALLVVPATGRPSGPVARGGVVSRVLGVAAAACAAGLVALAGRGLAAAPPPPPAATAHTTAVPATRGERVRWSEFGPGLARARAEGKLLLATFVTSWCGYCAKMDSTTWTHPSVVERLDDVVPVRVDTEDTRQVEGFTGAALGARYQISGTPTTLLLDARGRVIARADGYRTAEQLLNWLEDALNRGARPGAAAP